MICAGAILAHLFGRNASPQIVEKLGGKTFKRSPSKVLLAKFLDFAADPHSRAILWKKSTWKDFKRNDCFTKLRLVGVSVVDATLTRGKVSQRTIRRLINLPQELIVMLGTTKKYDIQAFARSAHNVFEQEAEMCEQFDAEMATPATHETPSKGSSSSSSSGNPHSTSSSATSSESAPPQQRQITWNEDGVIQRLVLMGVQQPSTSTVRIAMSWFMASIGDVQVYQAPLLQLHNDQEKDGLRNQIEKSKIELERAKLDGERALDLANERAEERAEQEKRIAKAESNAAVAEGKLEISQQMVKLLERVLPVVPKEDSVRSTYGTDTSQADPKEGKKAGEKKAAAPEPPSSIRNSDTMHMQQNGGGQAESTTNGHEEYEQVAPQIVPKEDSESSSYPDPVSGEIEANEEEMKVEEMMSNDVSQKAEFPPRVDDLHMQRSSLPSTSDESHGTTNTVAHNDPVHVPEELVESAVPSETDLVSAEIEANEEEKEAEEMMASDVSQKAEVPHHVDDQQMQHAPLPSTTDESHDDPVHVPEELVESAVSSETDLRENTLSKRRAEETEIPSAAPKRQRLRLSGAQKLDEKLTDIHQNVDELLLDPSNLVAKTFYAGKRYGEHINGISLQEGEEIIKSCRALRWPKNVHLVCSDDPDSETTINMHVDWSGLPWVMINDIVPQHLTSQKNWYNVLIHVIQDDRISDRLILRIEWRVKKSVQAMEIQRMRSQDPSSESTPLELGRIVSLLYDMLFKHPKPQHIEFTEGVIITESMKITPKLMLLALANCSNKDRPEYVLCCLENKIPSNLMSWRDVETYMDGYDVPPMSILDTDACVRCIHVYDTNTGARAVMKCHLQMNWIRTYRLRLGEAKLVEIISNSIRNLAGTPKTNKFFEPQQIAVIEDYFDSNLVWDHVSNMAFQINYDFSRQNMYIDERFPFYDCKGIENFVENVHFKTTICLENYNSAITARRKLTDEGLLALQVADKARTAAQVERNKQQKFKEAHSDYMQMMAKPIATSLRFLRVGDRVYVNPGFLGNPVPLNVGIFDTCRYLGDVKSGRRSELKLQKIQQPTLDDTSHQRWFYLPARESSLGDFISSIPFIRTHKTHRKKISQEYSETGKAAIRDHGPPIPDVA